MVSNDDKGDSAADFTAGARNGGVTRGLPASYPIAAAVVLVVADLLLVWLDVLLDRQVLHDARFSIGWEGGFAERWQHLKAGIISVMLCAVAGRRRSAVVLTWAAVFLFVLADDALQLHERVGNHLGEVLTLPELGSLRANHLGELLYFAAIGIVTISGLLIALRAGDGEDWTLSRTLVLWLALLAVFGVVLDAIHSALRRTALGRPLELIEDGGEMIILTLALGHVYAYWTTRGGTAKNKAGPDGPALRLL